MKKKVLAAILVAAMTMGLAACGSKSNDSAPADTAEKTEEAADGEETADAEAADGEEKYPEGYTLRVGMNCGAAPFGWTQDDDSNGAWPIDGTDQYVCGYDVQVARKICDTYGWNLKIIKTDWDGLIPGVVSGKLDCCISTLGVTEERLQSVDFSDYYWNNGCVMVVRKDSKYANATSIQDFAAAERWFRCGGSDSRRDKGCNKRVIVYELKNDMIRNTGRRSFTARPSFDQA